MSATKSTGAEELRIPPLIALAGRHEIGTVRQVLRPGCVIASPEGEAISVSSRKIETAYVLPTGERLIVTNRKSCPLPMGVDGVVMRHADGQLYWLSHQLVDDFKEQVRANKLAERRDAVAASWADILRYRGELLDRNGRVTRPGLRPPQLGALHAIGAHWSQHHHPATVVMPTGTGKTETMLAALLAHVGGPLIVVVPSQALRDQIAHKFLTLGLLRQLGVIPDDVSFPMVGVMTKRPRSADDLDIFDNCNVVVSTMAALGQGEAAELASEIAARVNALIVDEAHHVPAASWTGFREQFAERRVLQFTATPYRRDGQLVDGTVIYSYPLHRAQQDGYFKPITFSPVYELDPEEGDDAIAAAALQKLREDLAKGLDHLLMARCDSIARAKRIHAIYQRLGAKYDPLLIHSDEPMQPGAIDRLRTGTSRIVVCVDMLGEGFDLPQLKIAAIHDTHKSLAVLLQFTGPFTRVAGAEIGEATVIANIADQRVSDALERLYSEDADWNVLLSEFSSKAIREHEQLVEFLTASKDLFASDADDDATVIARSLLRPTFSAVVFRCESFRPKKFHEALGNQVSVRAAWLHEPSQTLYFVTRSEPQVGWSRSKQLRDRQWDLFVLHHDPCRKLLYLHSSDTGSLHEELARAVGGKKIQLIQGKTVFRTLGNIKRLVFQNIGVRKVGRRNLRYAMYTGAEVEQALTIAEKAGSVKSNLSGTGYEDGQPVTIGCSYKGRVWSREHGPIRGFLDWCSIIGGKLINESISTDVILDNVMLQREVASLPTETILSLDWPLELLRQSEERVVLKGNNREVTLSLCGIEYEATRADQESIFFRIESDQLVCKLCLKIGGHRGFEVKRVGGQPVMIQVGRLEQPLESYLSDYPPLVRFCDLSELDGNLLVSPKERRDLALSGERFESWDWSGTDITLESIWKDGKERSDSVQQRAADHYRNGGFQLVFNDDDKGEAADLICLKEETDRIRLALVHCKFSGKSDPGARVKDVVEVCSQAVRSAKWQWRFRELCRHIVVRERKLRTAERPTRFIYGKPKDLNHFMRVSRFKPVRAEIVIVQPGLSQKECSADQTAVLAAADAFLQETVGVNLDIVCSE
jgi:superfamily II DNA or RNA helicase